MQVNRRILNTILVALLCFITAPVFSQASTNEAFLKKEILGEWRNVYVKITMHTVNNTDSSQIAEADSTNWEARLHIKPIRTHFKADGTYSSEYRNTADSIVRRPAGRWFIKDDSITMTQITPDKSAYTLKLIIKNNRATFSGLLDFDGDAKKDDEYYGIQKKFE